MPRDEMLTDCRLCHGTGESRATAHGLPVSRCIACAGTGVMLTSAEDYDAEYDADEVDDSDVDEADAAALTLATSDDIADAQRAARG